MVAAADYTAVVADYTVPVVAVAAVSSVEPASVLVAAAVGWAASSALV